jgi:hypothetical protein
MTTTAEPLQIEVIYSEMLDADGQKGLFDGVRRITRMGTLDPDVLTSRLSLMCKALSAVFDATGAGKTGYELHEFDVHVEITAGGEVRLIGGISTELSGGLTLHFRRTRDSNE